MTFWPLTNSDFPTDQTSRPISWSWYQAWPSPNYEWFPWSICNECDMPAGNANPSGYLVPSRSFGTCFCSNCWDQILRICLFPGVLWLWHFLYSVGPHPVSSLHIYTFVVSRAFMAGAASQAGDADSSRAPGLTSGLQGSVNVHRGTLLLVPQWQCISSFVFYIFVTLVPFAVWSW